MYDVAGSFLAVSLEGPSPTHSARLSLLLKKLEKLGIEGHKCTPGQHYNLLCPMCKGGDSGEPSLSMHISEDGNSAVWICFRGKCGWQGNTLVELLSIAAVAGVRSPYGKLNQTAKPIRRELSEKNLGLEPLCDELLAYFAERMITAETLRRNYVMQKSVTGGQVHVTPLKIVGFRLKFSYLDFSDLNFSDLVSYILFWQIAIAFTFRREGVLINCKYRDVTKKFWQEPDTETILYGLDDIKNASDIIIVEGEIDKLAMEEAGFLNCVSVPDGAPSRVSDKDVPPPDKLHQDGYGYWGQGWETTNLKIQDTCVARDIKYQYLWNCKEYFEKASRIILATDADPPGQALAEELARRLGRERCWRVTWPKKNDSEYFKDANEVLMYMGPEKLKETVDNAELYPIRGLFSFRDYFHEIDAYYHRVLGDELGISTGWRCLDEYYNVVPGELTVVTGVPNSGKSEWIDALLCNLNESVGWKFALCSMENKEWPVVLMREGKASSARVQKVREHGRKLLEKHVKKPFFDVRLYLDLKKIAKLPICAPVGGPEHSLCSPPNKLP
ncbi:Twinkle-like protein chloroplastic/mitochondrial [Bienertia sinuspersici]